MTIKFESVQFDQETKAMTILQGTKGSYDYTNIKKCRVLNEKAKYHEKEEPFFATVPNGPLGGGSIWEFSIFVGLKITMMDDTILAIYTSKIPTTINTDFHIRDRKEAEKIKSLIDRMIDKYQKK